ncbi:hypothetical protein SAMN00768000_0014 [Sulfobacillus thermosulfidooxidans DSM 9293]|uniref:Uncharacterized protein n=1 Tax=Sulfobacillus thermosulfidooxidans (strain DSM 9293 / VKM B-1269 / AT-1) TaxID=929705 RepID=A0A1W1W5N7_SULTA|nr:hypothetical protein [Sulfobacillus thermosulfidooxidans]SMC01594.1 hypothetical protein SAMN00768000_0014 [Sulfobacillus thermosulfidooxidans DSM 9293]
MNETEITKEVSSEVLAAITAALLCMENIDWDTTRMRIREVWPEESAWRWVGW